VIVEIVTEELDVRDCGGGDVGIGKVAREEDKGDITDVVRVFQTRDLPDFKRRIAACEKHLRCVLDLR
jgi:hypothetical protein